MDEQVTARDHDEVASACSGAVALIGPPARLAIAGFEPDKSDIDFVVVIDGGFSDGPFGP